MVLLLPIVGLALWIWSVSLVKNWKYFWTYFIINFLIVVGYIVYILYGDMPLLGHDEYGLGRLFMLFAFPIGYAILGFLIALIINRKITIANKMYN